MNRRDFLQALSASALAGALPGFAGAQPQENWQSSFRKALGKNPYLLGYLGSNQEVSPSQLVKLEGRVPDDLSGVFYRHGPARHEIGSLRYHHWFDGDGLVQAFQIRGGHVTYQARLVGTAKYRSEKAAGRALEQGFGTAVPGLRSPGHPDALNTANINVLQHEGELLALWEGGSAYRLESKDLTSSGPKTWSPETKGLPFGAHPRVDRDGSLWNIGYVPAANALIIYHIKGGTLLKSHIVRLEKTPMIHDFAMTEKYLIIVMPPLFFDSKKTGSFLDHFVWEADKPCRFFIFDKTDLSRVEILEAPAFWVFHFGNAWEGEEGGLHVDFIRYDDPSVMLKNLRYVMRGEERPFSPPSYVKAYLNLQKKQVHMEVLEELGPCEFPEINPMHMTKRHRHSFLMTGRDGGVLSFDGFMKVHLETGKTEKYMYGDLLCAEEHIFVPRGKDDKGWILGTNLDLAEHKTTLNVFDSEAIADGPVLRAHLPFMVPLGLHGHFVSEQV